MKEAVLADQGFQQSNAKQARPDRFDDRWILVTSQECGSPATTLSPRLAANIVPVA
jgi:hypothetical protein